jgi:hypothetical protein
MAKERIGMSVQEAEVSLSEESKLLEKIEAWRLRRAEMVSDGMGPVRLRGQVTMLFHAVPRNSLTRRLMRESWRLPDQERLNLYVPCQATRQRYNEDGYIASAQAGNEPGAFAYTQLFRSGIAEYADSNCFGSPMAGFEPMILGQRLEQEIVNCYKDVIDRVRRTEQNEPVYIGISLIGIAGKVFFSTVSGSVFPRTGSLDRNIFISPEVLANIDDPEDLPYARTLLPLVDTMWQVDGIAQTPFRRKGDWKPFEDRH